MAKTGSQLSVAQLERLLATGKDRLAALMKRRVSLQASLATVEKEIRQLSGAAPTKRVRRKIGKRPKNRKSLKQRATEVLGKYKRGLTLKDLSEKIKATGYKTISRKFSNVVYQTLFANKKEFRHDEKTGKYLLK